MTSKRGHRSPRRSRAGGNSPPAFVSRTMIPIAIRISGKSRPRFRYIRALSTPKQQQEPEHDQHRGPEEIPTNVVEHAQGRQQEVGAQRDQDEARPQPWRPVAVRRSPPSKFLPAPLLGRVGMGGSSFLRPREAGSKILPDVVAHRAEALTDAPGRRRWRPLRWLHQEPEHEVEEDPNARWHQG